MLVVEKLTDVFPAGTTNVYQTSSSAVPAQPVRDWLVLAVFTVTLLQVPLVGIAPKAMAPAHASLAGGKLRQSVKLEVPEEE